MNKVYIIYLIRTSVLLVALLAGCSGVKSRIKENERLFATFPPEVQSQIQSGRIDYGFTEDMVFVAKGEPNEKTKVRRSNREITIWKYLKRGAPPQPENPNGAGLSSPYGYPGFGPGPSQPAPLFYERQFYNVEFVDGKVTGWDAEFQKD